MPNYTGRDLGTEFIEHSPSLRYGLQHKFESGQHFLDLRKWVKYGNLIEFIPLSNKSRRGSIAFCTSFDDWEIIAKRILELVEKHRKST